MNRKWILSGLAAALGVWGARSAAGTDPSAPEPLVLRDPLYRLSRTASGESGGARLSPGGRFLLFLSTADDLVTNSANGLVMDLFVRELSSGQTTLISVSPDGGRSGDADTYQGAISADGRWVAFESSARNLTVTRDESESDGPAFFLRDRLEGVTRRILLPAAPVPSSQAFPQEVPVVMDDSGRRIAMVRGGHLYVYDRETNDTRILTRPTVSPSAVGMPRTWNPQFSADGQVLAFGSSVNGLVRPPGGAARPLQVYIARFTPGNLASPELTQLRITNAALPRLPEPYATADHALSPDGRVLVVGVPPSGAIASTADLGVFRWDLESQSLTHLTAGMSIGRGSDLRVVVADRTPDVAFEILQGGALVTTRTNGLFVWSPEGGRQIIPRSDGDPMRPLSATPLGFTDDGRHLFVNTSETNVVAGLTDVRSRYAFHELTSGVTRLAIPDSARARSAVLSGAGTSVVFESSAQGLAAEDFNQASDLFLVTPEGAEIELLTARLESLLPRTPGGMTALPDVAFSADGRRVVFESAAEDLVPGDDNRSPDVFVRDLESGGVRLVSVSVDGVHSGSGPSGQPRISADGRWVAFVSIATNLVAGEEQVRSSLFVRDLVENSTQRISGVTTDPESAGDVSEFTMSENGQRFAWLGRNVSSIRVLFRDVPSAGAIRVLDNSPSVSALSLSGDGRVVAYVAGDSSFVFRRLDSGMVSRLTRDPDALTRPGIILSRDGSRAMLLGERVGLVMAVPEVSGEYRYVPVPGPRLLHDAVREGALSRDGRWFAYSAMTVLISRQLPSGVLGVGVFLRDLATGESRMLSEAGFNDRPWGPSGRPETFDNKPWGDSGRPAISPDGRWVLYRSAASNLVPDDDNRRTDLFGFDRITGVTRLVSRADGSGVPWTDRTIRGQLSPDTASVWLTTFAPEVISGDWNGGPHTVKVAWLADTDADGWADDLERAWFGDLGTSGWGDADGDGMTNAEEAAAGTNPKDATSVLQLRAAPEADGGWEVSWSSVPGRRYRLVRSSWLSTERRVPWEAVGEVFTASSTSLTLKVPTRLESGDVFFRLIVAE